MPTPARNLLLSSAAAALAAAVLAPSAAAALPGDGRGAPAPAPSVRLTTVGLGARDIALSASSTRTEVTLQPGDAFTAYATSTTPGATVRLRKTVTRRCQRADGYPDDTAAVEQPLYGDAGYVTPPAADVLNVGAYPWNSGCEAGQFLESVKIAHAADARTTTGGRSSTPEAVFTYSPGVSSPTRRSPFPSRPRAATTAGCPPGSSSRAKTGSRSAGGGGASLTRRSSGRAPAGSSSTGD